MNLFELLTRLIRLDGEPKALGALISSLGLRMRCKDPICTLTLADVKNALDRFLNFQLPEDELVYWADSLELNPCVLYDPGFEEIIANLLFRISSPEINGAITLDEMRQIRAGL